MLDTEKIAEQFRSGIDCGQVVAEPFTEETGLTQEQLRKATSCFGGGLLNGDTCGAYVAGLVVLGLEYGNSEENDFDTKDAVKMKQYEFMKAFLEKYPSLNCGELLKSQGDKPVVDVMFSLCPEICAETVEMLKGLQEES